MKYDSTSMANPVLAKKYPPLQMMFDKNTTICGNFLSRKSQIKCEYVSSCPNVLANNRAVTEQRVHCDYNPANN